MKKVLENRWIMFDPTTKATWSATISNTREMCRVAAIESLALDGRTLEDTNFKPVKCTVTIEIFEEQP